MRKLLNYIYTHYNNQIANEKTSLIHIIHHKICSSKLIARMLFHTRIDPIILREKKSFPHLFDLTSILMSLVMRSLLKKDSRKKILDIGTGRYGILSIFLKKKYPNIKVVASDIEKTFVRNANINFSYNDVDVNCQESNLFDNINEFDFDFIIWNLPYYAEPENYLNDFFNETSNRLSKQGTIILGYNSFATTNSQILNIIKKFKKLKVTNIKNYYWNNHRILTINKFIET